eukprot:g20641.t1
MGVRGRTFRAIRRGDVHYSESGEELICFVADDKVLGMTNRTVVVECACQEDKEACLIHGARRKELERNIVNNDWADVAEQLHLEYPTITEHSLRRTAALQARRLIESGNHCDIVKFVNDRGWLLVKTFLDYACDLQDWQHKKFLTNTAIWPAVLSVSDSSSHGLKFSDRTGITKVTKTLRTELGAEAEPAPQQQAEKAEPLYVTKAKSATMGKMPQVHKVVPTTRGGKALIPIGAPLTSKKGHNATRKYDGKPWPQLPKGESPTLNSPDMSTLDARIHAAEMLFAVKDYVAARRRSSDTTVPPDTRDNAEWAKRDRAGWLKYVREYTLLTGVKTIGNSDQSGVWALDPSVRPISQEEVDDYVTAKYVIRQAEPTGWDLRLYANMARVPVWELLSRDFSKYYYLFGVDDPAKNNIEFWDPHDHRWRVVQSLVLSMGNSHSVPGACRVSEAMRSIYAHAGGICNLYIDDGFIFAPDPEAMEACRECYDTLAGALGLPLSPKDDGNQCSCDIMQDGGTRDFVRGLGVRYVCDRSNNCIYARVPPDVIRKCQEKITIILLQLQEGCLRRKTVQQAIGVANYIICHTTRAGAEFLRAAYPWTSEEEFPARVRSRELRNAFVRTLKTLYELLPKLPPVRILFRVQRTNFIWLDASTNGAGLCTVTHEGRQEEVGKPMIGGIMITSEGVVKSFAIEMNPQYTTPTGTSRILNIQVLECLTAAFAQRIWRRDMRDAMNRIGVDNMCELYAFVKLSTRNNSAASVATYVAAESLNIGGRNLWAYTNTKFNPADAFCRRELLQAALQFWKPQDHYGTRSINDQPYLPDSRIPHIAPVLHS